MPATDLFIILYQILIVLAIPLYIWTGYKLWQRYIQKRTGDASKWMALFFFSGAIAITLLLVEQVIMITSYPNSPLNVPMEIKNDLAAVIARIFVCLAILISSGITAPVACKFALTFFDEKAQLLIFPIFGLGLLHSLLYFILPFEWIQREAIWEYYHAPEYQLFLLATFLVPVWMATVFIGYVTINASIKHKPPHIVNRSFLLLLGMFIESTAYTLQVITPSLITGFGLFYFAIHYYFVLTMPDWLKRWLKWPESS
ncbi:MAG: hypothetical protein ACXAEU_08075 [Candidatus Hodarchaeales archaeon]